MEAVLYGFIWSSCSWRVRAALYLKHIPYTESNIDIMKQRKNLTEEYRKINPSQKVPALFIDGMTLVESMAILQYLEETRPIPRLIPESLLQRIKMRQICETIVSGIQPLQNIGLKPHFSTEEDFTKFTAYWTVRGLQTLDDLLHESAGKFCVGDEVSMADLCFVPQVYNAVNRYKLDVSKFGIVNKLYENIHKEKVFQETHPFKAKEQMKREEKVT